MNGVSLAHALTVASASAQAFAQGSPNELLAGQAALLLRRFVRVKLAVNERARGDTTVYDFNRRIITMAGNVRLNRGGDTLNGGRLVIDLATGVSSVDGRASGSSSVTGQGQSGGRVTGTFSVPEN